MSIYLWDRTLVDVSHPTHNVLFELGIACSLRSEKSVLITSTKPAQLTSSEIIQLQLTWYQDYEDIKRIITDSLAQTKEGLTEEVERYLATIHERLSPGSIGVLLGMQSSAFDSTEKAKELHDVVRWHVSYSLPRQVKAGEGDSLGILPQEFYAREIVESRLARFNYAWDKDTGNWEWALHPTPLGKYYLSSLMFLEKFHSLEEASTISEKLRKCV